jgi:subfamily B ATP-binding cassette protein MsbA
MGEVTQVAQEAVTGYREMYLFGGQDYEKARMQKASNTNRRQSLKLAATSGISTPLVQILVAIAMSVLIWLTLTPDILKTMTTGGFAKFIFTASLMGKPLRQLTQINEQVQQGIAAAETLFSTLDRDEEIDTGNYEKERVEGRFQFRDVNFSYGKSREAVLRDISFDVAPGETIALVGSSGAGKSTLVSLIPRFYNHGEGQILLDGVDVNDYRLINLRKHISLVSQQVTLFNDSVYRNIAYGELAQCSAEQVHEAARMAYALNFIEALPNGFDTLIGDDGVMLSGGQRQRLAIARALLKDAPILILDEATSALDTESERYIQAALEVAMKGRTTFFIAHRQSTVHNDDPILVLEQGRLVEEGTHQSLLAAAGRYAQLYQQHFAA